jgi:Uma2 family endonuclease
MSRDLVNMDSHVDDAGNRVDFLRIPAGVRDLQSFCQWAYYSGEAPECLHFTYMDGTIYIELNDEDAVYIPADARTLEGFRRWARSDEFPERGRISYLDGEIEIDMSPEEIETHNKVKGDTHGDLRNFVRGRDLGDLLCDGVMVVNKAAGLATEPDMLFCSWESLQSGSVRYVAKGKGSDHYVEVNGSPDMTLEIVSRTSVQKDTVEMPQKYFRAEIPEYWLIDARRGRIDFRIHVRGDGEYRLSEADADGYVFSPVFQAWFLLTRDVNRVGGYRYTLLHRPA